MNWKGLASAAALAVFACGRAAFASDAPSDSSAGDSLLTTPVFLDDTTAPTTMAAPAASAPSETKLTPVMYLLSPTGFGQWLTNNNFSVTGFVEAGYFIDTNNPRLGTGPNGDAPTDVWFPGQYSNRFLLDQLDISFSKTVDTTKKFDWGFLVEAGYGTDDSYIHSHGLLDNRPPDDPQNQLDVVQANVSVLIGVGNGLTITGGKFVALVGQEVINPTGNLFYTHSYSFFYADPATNTGIIGTYTFPKLLNGNDWTLTGGITEGWNQSLRNNNGDIDGLIQFKGNITTALSVVSNVEVGPQATHDSSDYTTTLEVIPSLTVSDQLTLTGDFIYNDSPHGAVPGVAPTGVTEQWYGACLYGSYKINSMFTANVRGEWFRDQGGALVGTTANYYEVTLGTQIHPLPDDNIFQWLQIRPEVRGDFSDRRVYNVSHGGDHNQLTAAVDVIMQF